MKFLHLSDLHIGKKLNGFSLLDDQKHILKQIHALIDEYSPDAIIIAGDVYDSQTPPVEAVTVLDRFLTEILDKGKLLFIVSGNHDSPERLSFGSEIMKPRGLYIEGIFSGVPAEVALEDSFGNINVHLLPFIKPSNPCLDGKAETYNDATALAISKAKINTNERNILISHQFVTSSGNSPERSDSEMKYAGGLDNVDCSVFAGFDYVALGHLHCPQKITENVVYGGSPLKYSVSERFQRKCAVFAEIREKGVVNVETIPFKPLRDLRQIKGELESLLKLPKSEDYVSVVLTGGERHLEPLKRIREVYCNCISVEYEDERETGGDSGLSAELGGISGKSHLEIFTEFYAERNGTELDETAKEYLTAILDEISEGGAE